MSLRELASGNRTGAKSKKRRKTRGLSSKDSKKIKRLGYRAERQLVEKPRAAGFKAVRIPVSAPSSEPLPDVFAVKGGCMLALEVKATNGERVYFKKPQVNKLFRFLEMFEVYAEKRAILVGKFPRKWVFKQAEKVDDYVLHKNDKSSFQLKLKTET